jgi:solute:Na+ symporter, SSS family
MPVKPVALAVFILLFALVTGLGFWAARWRRGDLNLINEWGLAGSRFGTLVSWFLIGGDLYTAYTFIAVPGLIFGAGALGFFAVPYTTILYPMMFLIMPRMWTVARRHGYVTAADFVRGRFDSPTLALAVAVTGILATMPYIALQMFGIEVSIAQMGVPVEASLIIAFLILAAFTYISGLRAPALIAVVKDLLLWITVIVAVIAIPIKLGGFGKIFAAVQAAPKHPSLVLAPTQYSSYATLALASAAALLLYPHVITGVFATNSRAVVKRNAALLPAYSFMLGIIALLGYMAVAAHVTPMAAYGANGAVPALITAMFPEWFAGFAFAAISIGALVPASIMSIAAASLFSRNIWKEYVHPNCGTKEEADVAKVTSLVVKVGALLFILLIAPTYAIDFQLLGGVWILQTLPAVILGLYTRWFHRWAMLAGWAVGMIYGTALAVSNHFSSVYPFTVGGKPFPLYAAFAAVIVNLIVSAGLTLVFKALGLATGQDETTAADFQDGEPTPAVGLA